MAFFIETRMAKTGKPYFSQSTSPIALTVSVKDVEPPWARSCMNPTSGFVTLQEAQNGVDTLRLKSSGFAIEYRIVEVL